MVGVLKKHEKSTLLRVNMSVSIKIYLLYGHTEKSYDLPSSILFS